LRKVFQNFKSKLGQREAGRYRHDQEDYSTGGVLRGQGPMLSANSIRDHPFKMACSTICGNFQDFFLTTFNMSSGQNTIFADLTECSGIKH
jgi:hypothetical protein